MLKHDYFSYFLCRLVRAVFLFPAYLEKNGNRLQRNLEHKYKEYLTTTNTQEAEEIDNAKKEEDKNAPKETKKKK